MASVILSGIPGGQSPFEIDLNGIMRNIVLKNQMILRNRQRLALDVRGVSA